jgi:ribosome-associated protein
MQAMERQSIRVTSRVAVPLEEIELRVSRSSGPGGQHANTAETRVEAVFDVEASTALSDAQKRRVVGRVGPVLRAVAQDERSQLRNRELALERLVARLREALRVQRRRVPTRPTAASRERRLEEKKRRSETKPAAEVVLDGGQRHVHHRRVDEDDGGAEDGGDEDLALLGGAQLGGHERSVVLQVGVVEDLVAVLWLVRGLWLLRERRVPALDARAVSHVRTRDVRAKEELEPHPVALLHLQVGGELVKLAVRHLDLLGARDPRHP